MGDRASAADRLAAAGRIQVLDRATALMRAIAQRPRTLNAHELARACDLNRTTAWRILVALEHNGLVHRDPSTQRYALGVALAQLGAQADVGPLIRLAHRSLQALADELGEQVSLGVPIQLGFSYVEHLQPQAGGQVPRWLGESGPLHATASGKVFLSRLTAPEREALLGAELERFTRTTITDRAALDRELRAVARDGFAVATGERDELTSAVCAPVSDPSTGGLLAIVDVWGPSQRLTRRRLRQLGPRLRQTAGAIAGLIAEREAELA
jgi:DNA-binding IclR family transcriptional regulator